MKTWIAAALVVAMAAPLIPTDADAKRFGGARSSGMQRDMPARTAPDAPPARPATPQQGQPTQAGQSAAPAAGVAAAGATARRSWMGPIAGLAAGLGIAALASALGFGEALANFLTIALLIMAVLLVVGFVMRRMSANKAAHAAASAGANRSAGGAQVAWPGQQRTADAPAGATGANRFEPVMSPSAGNAPAAAAPSLDNPVQTPVAVAERSAPRAFVPAAFDAPAFERAAKMIFIRLQAANDTGDLNDLRSFTTPEMFAEIKLDLQERGATGQHTDVVKVDAQVLDVSQEAESQIVSVRFTGQVREESGGSAEDFDEVWHMVKPLDDSRGWAIAGIEQMSHRN